MNILKLISSVVGSGLIAAAALFGVHQQPTQIPQPVPVAPTTQNALQDGLPLSYGATVASSPALFDTILSSPLNPSDTTMYLKSVTTTQGDTLSGYQCFTIDVNTTSLEYLCGTISGTTVINMTRNLDGVTATTTSASTVPTHRTGADVRITDFPDLTILSNIMGGRDSISNTIYYASTVSTSTIAQNRNNLATWGLVQDTQFSTAGAIAATTNAKGYVQISTNTQAASSTQTGSSGAYLALTSAIATSTGGTSAALNVIVANNSGSLDQSFLPASTTVPFTFGGSTYFGSTYSQDIGKHEVVFNTTGTSTWAVPSGIHTIFARMVGGGGGGGNGCTNACGGGGGSGGYSEGMINVSATSSLTVFVGAAGQVVTNSTGSTGGTTTISATTTPIMSATGGGGGTIGSSGDGNPGGGGGTASGGQLNSSGTSGGFGLSISSSFTLGIGAASPLGQSCGGGGNGNTNGNAGCVLLYY